MNENEDQNQNNETPDAINKHIERYRIASHAMQSGVAMEMNYDFGPTEPKHLRTGINARAVDAEGLVTLLISKGIFTEEEYLGAIADAMEREVKRYEKHLSDRYGGKKVTLA